MAVVFVSSDYKYFTVSLQDCARSPCTEIISQTSYLNMAVCPMHFITSTNGVTMALLLASGNVPFQMAIKPLEETLKIFQNLSNYADVMRIAGNIANLQTYQRLYDFYARTLEVHRLEMMKTLATTITSEDSNTQKDSSDAFLVLDETSKETAESDDPFADFTMLDIDFGDDVDFQPIDKFLEDLANNNIHNTE